MGILIDWGIPAYSGSQWVKNLFICMNEGGSPFLTFFAIHGEAMFFGRAQPIDNHGWST